MHFARGIWIIFWAFVIARCAAESTADQDGPLNHYEFITDPVVHVLPRIAYVSHEVDLRRRSVEDGFNSTHRMQSNHLLHDDSFRLTFTSFNKTFHLHLRPNYNLLHPNAQVTYHGLDGSTRTERLSWENERVFRGVVIDEAWSDAYIEAEKQKLAKMSSGEATDYDDDDDHDDFAAPGVLGWARVYVHPDSPSLRHTEPHEWIFDAAFTHQHETYHIKPIQTYRLVKRTDDPEISTVRSRHDPRRAGNARMMMYRDGDKVLKVGHLGQRLASSSSRVGRCGVETSAGKATYFGFRSSQPAFSDRSVGNVPIKFAWMNAAAVHDYRRHRLQRRATVVPPGCPTNKMIIYMGAAADCTYVTIYKTTEAARKQILVDWNQASAIYERTFNVQLGIILIDIRNPTCPPRPDVAWNRDCSDAYTINNRLSDFSRWRGEKGDDGAGLWHLVTKCATGSKIGVAWLKALCQIQAQPQTTDGATEYTTGAGVSTVLKDEYKVIAHEIGHNFGAQHDCEVSTCPCVGQCGCCPCDNQCDCQGVFLMNPTADVKTNDFSPCSIREICANYPAIGGCLDRSPGRRKTLSIAMCGNGLKEDGEECDCGSAADCATDPCCDGTTCKLKNGAKCSDRNDDCCQNCTIRAAKSVCRKAVSVCDIEEVCDGQSPTCPPDVHVDDGKPCDNPSKKLKCASGLCTSRDLQCSSRATQRIQFTKACPVSIVGNTCAITCLDNANPPNCFQLSGVFLDGTECGNGGRCDSGTCRGDSIFNTILDFVKGNVWVPIALSMVAGSCLLCCCFQWWRRRKAEREYYKSMERMGVGASGEPLVVGAPVDPYSGYPVEYGGPGEYYQMQPQKRVDNWSSREGTPSGR